MTGTKKKCKECGYEVFDSLAEYLARGGDPDTSRPYLAINHKNLGHTIESIPKGAPAA